MLGTEICILINKHERELTCVAAKWSFQLEMSKNCWVKSRILFTFCSKPMWQSPEQQLERIAMLMWSIRKSYDLKLWQQQVSESSIGITERAKHLLEGWRDAKCKCNSASCAQAECN